MSWRSKRSEFLALVALTVGLAGCSDSSSSGTDAVGASATASSGSPVRGAPVVMISVDTLRSDRLGAYGFDLIETPAIDRLAAEGVLFERAYSHLPLTLPSHASILTGRLPIEHRVRDNLGYRLGAEPPTLGEILAAEGYATGGFVSAYVLREQTGISRGFDAYDDAIVVRSGVELGGLQRRGGDTLDRALEWLDNVRAENADRPFFLFFHIYEPHTPYAPNEPWASRYPHHPYDAEVAEADAIVGNLIAALEERDLYNPSLLILLSDHGEGLGDHGEMEHEVLIYRETLQVPLIFKLPDGFRAGERISEGTQLIDVFPTVLRTLGLSPEEHAGDDLQGMDLLGVSSVPENRQIFSESIYPRLHFGWSDLASLIEGRFHYIHSPAPELFDLIADPAETNNILRENRAVYRRLSGALEEIDREIEPPSQVDSDVRDRLASLGYVGGGVGIADGDLPDPKARIGVLEDLGAAGGLLAKQRYEEAARAYGEIAEREPQMVFAWEQLAKAHRRAGQLDEAQAALERALRLSKGAGHVALAAAELYLERGQLPQAREHAEIAIASQDAAVDILAQIALREGQLIEAESLVERALRDRGTRIEPLITATELAVAKESFDEALSSSQRALQEFGERDDVDVLRGLHYQRGVALANLGRSEEAEQAFRSEIELSPQAIAPATRLALLLALGGRGGEAVQELRRMVEINESPQAYAEAVKSLQLLGNPEAAQSLLGVALRRWPEDPTLRELLP